MSLKILLAEDHHIFRQGLVKIIESEESLEIVAEVDNGDDALRRIVELQPDVAVLDISMPGMTGLEVARKVLAEKLKTRLVILTMYKDEDFLEEAIDLKVKGYVLKSNTADDLLKAIECAGRDESYISQLFSDVLVRRREKRKQVMLKNPNLDTLSPTEKVILKKISLNKTSKQIADEMYISFRTVQKHRANICSKLSLNGWNALLTFAVKNKSSIE
ncbi:MAG TPA: response regulator transcription factor [Nitrospirae bacterium]|nr:response regulator transcription factor [Nitrospirota bacterium]